MAKTRDDIFRQALALDDADKSDLIAALIRSLDSETDAGAEEAWRTEVERRGRELQSGAVKAIPWDIVRERLSISK